MKLRFFTRIPLIVGFIFLIISARFLSWRLIPASKVKFMLTIPAGELAGNPLTAPQAIDQALDLRLTYPAKIRAGEKASLKLDVIPDTNSKFPGRQFSDSPAIAAELSMANMILLPQGVVSIAYVSDQVKSLTWELQASEAGDRLGNLWVTMNFFPNPNTKVEVPLAVWEIDIEVIRLWGLNSNQVTWLAMLALLLWGGMMVLGVKLEQSDHPD